MTLCLAVRRIDDAFRIQKHNTTLPDAPKTTNMEYPSLSDFPPFDGLERLLGLGPPKRSGFKKQEREVPSHSDLDDILQSAGLNDLEHKLLRCHVIDRTSLKRSHGRNQYVADATLLRVLVRHLEKDHEKSTSQKCAGSCMHTRHPFCSDAPQWAHPSPSTKTETTVSSGDMRIANVARAVIQLSLDNDIRTSTSSSSSTRALAIECLVRVSGSSFIHDLPCLLAAAGGELCTREHDRRGKIPCITTLCGLDAITRHVHLIRTACDRHVQCQHAHVWITSLIDHVFAHLIMPTNGGDPSVHPHEILALALPAINTPAAAATTINAANLVIPSNAVLFACDAQLSLVSGPCQFMVSSLGAHTNDTSGVIALTAIDLCALLSDRCIAEEKQMCASVMQSTSIYRPLATIVVQYAECVDERQIAMNLVESLQCMFYNQRGAKCCGDEPEYSEPPWLAQFMTDSVRWEMVSRTFSRCAQVSNVPTSVFTDLTRLAPLLNIVVCNNNVSIS